MSKNVLNNSFKKFDNKSKAKKEIITEEQLIKWTIEIKNEAKRDNAIENLSKYAEKNQNLAFYLWYSRGTMAIIIQEITSIYEYLSSSKLTLEKSNKICSAICLLQCISYNSKTRHEFLESKMPIFLYPFINNNNKEKPYEYLKLTSLGVICALLKINDDEIISFLIDSAIIPILLKIIEKGSELSRKIACCIVCQIVQDDNGKKYICEEKERYSAIIQYTKKMLKSKNNQRIINSMFKAFLKLAENNDAKNVLKNELLKDIKNENFVRYLDDSSKILLNNLLIVLNEKEKYNMLDQKKNFTNVNGLPNINLIKNNDIRSNLNHQIGINNGDMINQNNINNIIWMNQFNQIKMNPGFMVSQNYNDINYNIYNSNNNDNYINQFNYMNNLNSNKGGFVNMNFYNNLI